MELLDIQPLSAVVYDENQDSNRTLPRTLVPNINKNKLITLLLVKKEERFLKSNNWMPPLIQRAAIMGFRNIIKASKKGLNIKSFIEFSTSS
jgi:hypothetical protein